MSLPVPTTGSSSNGGVSTVNMDPRELAEMEAPLVALAQASGGDVRKLLYGFFSFLNRRTDFYVVHPSPTDDDSSSAAPGGPVQSYSMGFKEGDAEKLLLASFRQFPLRRLPPAKKQQHQTVQPSTTPAQSNSQTSKASKHGTEAIREPLSNDDEGSATASFAEAMQVDDDEPPLSKATTSGAATAATTTKQTAAASVRYTEEGLQVPVGNGGHMPAYDWTQTLDECTVLVPLPAECQRARELEVQLAPTRLSVGPKTSKNSGDVKGGGGEASVIVEGALTERIVPAESTWTIEGGVLVVTLHKAIPTFWKSVLVGDEEIDTTLVDSRRHIDEYDVETQAKLRKIMFDEQQLRRGLPTSDEILGIHPPPLPTLPPGVEYIDQSVLDQIRNSKKENGPT
jgi:N-terminal conserved domain of Nudc./CS domain